MALQALGQGQVVGDLLRDGRQRNKAGFFLGLEAVVQRGHGAAALALEHAQAVVGQRLQHLRARLRALGAPGRSGGCGQQFIQRQATPQIRLRCWRCGHGGRKQRGLWPSVLHHVGGPLRFAVRRHGQAERVRKRLHIAGQVGVNHCTAHGAPLHQLFGLPLQLAFDGAGGLHRRFVARLGLGVGQVNIGGVERGNDLLLPGKSGAHRAVHAHHPAHELQGKVGVVHALGAGQHKRARGVKARACRLLEDQHLLAAVVGNGGHQHRVGRIGAVLADSFGRHGAMLHQLARCFFHSVCAVGHLHQQERLAGNLALCQLAGNGLVARPGLAQHGAAHIGDLRHAAAQAVHHRLDVLLVQAGQHHIVAAGRKMPVRAVACMHQKIRQTLVFGRGGGH